MSIRIDVVDPSSERDLADAASLATAYWREVLGPDEPETLPAEMYEELHVGRADFSSTLLLARDATDAVGLGSIDVRQGMGNEHMAWVEDLFVLPSHRRHGIGSALFEEVICRAKEAGRSLVLGGYDDGNVGGAAFAAHVGADTGHAEKQNRALTAGLDRSMLEQWIADAATGAPGYSLVAFDDRCPDDLLDAVTRLAVVMNDAPRTDKLDDFVHTAQHVRSAEKEMAAAGTSLWYVAARHDASGELAGYTELAYNPRKPWLAEQGDTGVIAAHRGHGLGRWLKAVNALRLLDERPEVRLIETWNDGTNTWMLAINDAMGFKAVATWIETELELD